MGPEAEPAGLTVREAGEDDVLAIATIHVRSWQAAYRGVLPDELLDGLSVSERADRWRQIVAGSDERWLTLVAERPDGDLSGFCSVTAPSPEAPPGELTAEVGALYVDPEHWRQGAGGSMLSIALGELRELGFQDVILWVLPENEAALAFYERFGFEVEEGVEKREERSGAMVIRLRLCL